MADNRAMLRCRIFGHAWDEVPVGRVVDEYAGPMHYRVIIALQCMRCETARIDAWNRWGGLGDRKYIYPDGYRELNADLRENHRPDETSWTEAKRRYVAARSKEQKEERERGEGAKHLRVVGE